MNAPDKLIVSASRRNWLKAAGADGAAIMDAYKK